MLRFLSNEELKSFVAVHLPGTFAMHKLGGGLLNQNILVTAGSTQFALKVYRPKMDAAKVMETHRTMKFVADRGIPVTLPVAVDVVDGHVVALYPFVAGGHPPRYKNPRLKEMGNMLGRIDAALDAFRPAAPKPSPQELSRSQNIVEFLKELDAVRQSLTTHSSVDRAYVGKSLDALEQVITTVPWEQDGLDEIPVRPCHNDFHQHNVLMVGDRIATVLDWEKSGWQTRGFEVMRSVIFNCRFSWRSIDWDATEIYLRAYACHATLNQLERETAFLLGFQEMAFSLWAVKEYLGGHKETRGNITRRIAIMTYLAAHRDEFSERIAVMLTK